jgi:Domain of unknown function (DUF4476)
MKRFISCLVIALSVSSVFSQKVYFVYLQSESEQPFFVKMNDKLYSSAASGYLILSKLRDSSYNFTVGFPQNKWPEQQFSVDIRSADHGYLLKNFGDKGWGLFDLQTLAVNMGNAISSQNNIVKTEPKQVSAFTDVLSKAANDPSLKEKPVIVKAEEKPAIPVIPAIVKEEKAQVVNTIPVEKIAEPVVKKEEVAIVVPQVSEPEKMKESVSQAAVISGKNSKVTRRAESSTTDGFGVLYTDEYENGKTDTIRILIPNPKVPFVQRVEQKQVATEKVTAVIQPISTKASNNCTSMASEADFLKLRKKMAAEATDDAMLTAAKKVFKTKCFSIAQVKNLGNLFLKDAGKYSFFDMAYAYVSDNNNFGSLETELKDEYYINRFRAIIRP